MRTPKPRPLEAVLIPAILVTSVACRSTADGVRSDLTVDEAARTPRLTQLQEAQQHLEHLIFVVQENRSFDHYFGTFPGAEGIPMRNGRPSVCVLDPILDACARPYHTSSQIQEGGPHSQRASRIDVNGGRMDGFIRAAIDSPLYCADHRDDPACASSLGPHGQPD